MEDYEQHHATEWQRPEELAHRLQNRINIGHRNGSTSSSAPSRSPQKTTPSSVTPHTSTISSEQRRQAATHNSSYTLQPRAGTINRAALDVPGTFRAQRGGYRGRGRRSGPSRGGLRHRREAEGVASWHKQHAYDDRRETRQRQKSVEAQLAEQFLERPEDIDKYNYEFWYLWPSQDMPMEEILHHYDESTLQELRSGTQSHIEIDIPQSLIRVWSCDEFGLQRVALRIGNLVKELVAKINNSTKIRIVKYPQGGIENAVIVLNTESFANKAFPSISYHSESDAGEAEHRKAQAVKKDQQKTLALIVNQCFKNLRLPRQHVRMRLQIGLVFLGRRLRFKDGRNDYDFEEFEDMIGESLTEMELDSLTPRGMSDTQLTHIKALEILQKPSESYSASFYFTDDTNEFASTLVIRHEWAISEFTRELEMNQRQWISVPNIKIEKPLELTVVDFDRADCQLRIDVANRHDNKLVRKSLEKFEDTIGFQVDPDALLTQNPRPRANFQWVVPALRSVHEKTTLSFDIKDSTCKVAIIRTDEFAINTLLCKKTFVKSSFDFLIFDPDWDSNLSEFGTIGPGEEVSWKRTLNTFFPKPWSIQSDDVNEGFYNFMKVVENVVEQLQPILMTSTTESEIGSERDGY